jgi:uncharacterized protein Veg
MKRGKELLVEEDEGGEREKEKEGRIEVHNHYFVIQNKTAHQK